MKATILIFACALLGATGCATQQASDGGGTYAPMAKRRAHAKPGYGDDRPAPADLFGAAARGDLRGVQGALAQGAAVDGRNPNGATALLLAASSGSLPVVQTLLGAGADVNAADNNGRTPLAAATAGGYDDVARALKAAGARGSAGAEPGPAAPGQWWQKDGSAH